MKFNIKLSPQRRDDTLELEKQSSSLIVNGETFDFSPLKDGESINVISFNDEGEPVKVIDCEFMVGTVNRNGDTIDLTMILPNTAEASYEARFPEPILVENDGKVVLPE